MTETLETVAKKKPKPTAERVAEEEVVWRHGSRVVHDRAGLLKQLTKIVTGTALDQDDRTPGP